MKLETILNFISIVVIVLSAILTIITTIVNRIKANKIKNASVEEIEVLKSQIETNEGFIKAITDFIPTAITLAEENNVSGATKKIIAISKIIQDCSVNGINYNNLSEQINEVLENDIDLTKKVNSNKVRSI